MVALLIWFGFNLVMDFIAFVPAGQMFYLWFDLIIVPTLAVLFVILQRNRSPLVSLRVTYLFAFLLLGATAALSVVQGSALTFVIACYIVAAAVYLELWVAVASYSFAVAVYVVFLLVLFPERGGDLVHLIEIGAVGFFSIAVSRVLYRSRLRAYSAHRQVRRLTETQEQTIAARTAELRSANNRLQRQLREREILVQEIHHRVNNNLQVLASFMHIAGARSREEVATRMCNKMETRILTMAMVHQRLHELEDVAAVDASVYLSDLSRRLCVWSAGGKSVDLRMRVAPVALDIERAIHLGLIVTEVLTNTFTHGFKEERADYAVSVSLERGDGSLALTITDNGSTKAGDIPSAAGEHDGLGLLVIDSLAKQENAEYQYTASNGSSFRFVAPFDEREEGADSVASSPR